MLVSSDVIVEDNYVAPVCAKRAVLEPLLSWTTAFSCLWSSSLPIRLVLRLLSWHTLQFCLCVPNSGRWERLVFVDGFFFLILTSKTPKLRPSLPMTPASSRTSLVAVTLGSSSGSTPPPGTIHFSGLREDVTKRTLKATNSLLTRLECGGFLN